MFTYSNHLCDHSIHILRGSLHQAVSLMHSAEQVHMSSVPVDVALMVLYRSHKTVKTYENIQQRHLEMQIDLNIIRYEFDTILDKFVLRVPVKNKATGEYKIK